MSWSIARLASVAALVTTLAALPVAAAPNDTREAQARTLFFKGEYQRALDLFAATYADSGDPLLLRNIGRCHQKLRHPEQAIEAFRGYLRLSTKLKPAERDEIAGFIREMEALKAEQDKERAAAREAKAAEARAAQARATEAKAADAKAAEARTAGAKVAEAKAAGDPGTNLTLRSEPTSTTSASGADLSARPGAAGEGEAERESGSLTRRWWFWTAIGVVVVGGVVTALVLGGSRQAGWPSCPPMTDCPTTTEPGN
jgi:hypothetical protein